MLFLHVLNICGTVLYFRLVFGTLYPAYSSYKAVKSKDVREYVSILFYQIIIIIIMCYPQKGVVCV